MATATATIQAFVTLETAHAHAYGDAFDVAKAENAIAGIGDHAAAGRVVAAHLDASRREAITEPRHGATPPGAGTHASRSSRTWSCRLRTVNGPPRRDSIACTAAASCCTVVMIARSAETVAVRIS